MAFVHFLASFNSHLAHMISPLSVTSFFSLSSARRTPTRTTATASASDPERSFRIVQPPLNDHESSDKLSAPPYSTDEAPAVLFMASRSLKQKWGQAPRPAEPVPIFA